MITKHIVDKESLKTYHKKLEKIVLQNSGDQILAGNLILKNEDNNGNLTVQGNLTVLGKTITENHETITVEDNLLVLNSGKADLSTAFSGIVLNQNSEVTYGLVLDPVTSTFKFGKGTVGKNSEDDPYLSDPFKNYFTFSEGEGYALAIRADSSEITEGNLIAWDGTNNKLIDSKVNKDELSSATNIENGTGDNSVRTKGYNAQVSGEGSLYVGGERYDDYYDFTNGLTIEAPTPAVLEGKQSFAVGGGVQVYGDWNANIGKENKTYQRAAVAFGGGSKAGLTKDEFNTKFYDSANGVALNGGAGLDPDGNVLDADGKTYEKSYSFAVAMGQEAQATGKGSVAIGGYAKAYGNYSFSGNKATNSGIQSAAFNTAVIEAGASLSFAANGSTIKGTAEHSSVFGVGNEIASYAAFAAGQNNKLLLGSNFSAAFGHGNEIAVKYAAVFGKDNEITGELSNAFGELNIVEGSNSTVVGYNNTVDERSLRIFVAGASNITDYSQYSSIFGVGNYSTEDYAGFISGQNNKIEGATHAFLAGHDNRVIGGNFSAIFGNGNLLYSNASIISGSNNILDGRDNSAAFGKGLIAPVGSNQVFLIGSYNKTESTGVSDLLQVGFGSGESDRKNAFVVTSDGRAKVHTAPEDPDDLVRLSDTEYLLTIEFTEEAWISTTAAFADGGILAGNETYNGLSELGDYMFVAKHWDKTAEVNDFANINNFAPYEIRDVGTVRSDAGLSAELVNKLGSNLPSVLCTNVMLNDEMGGSPVIFSDIPCNGSASFIVRMHSIN